MCFRPAGAAVGLKCPKCGAFVEPDDDECYECGEPLNFGAAAGAPGAPDEPSAKAPAAPGVPGAPATPAAPAAPAAPGAPKASA